MSIELLIYLCDVIPSLGVVFSVGAIISIIVWASVGIFIANERSSNDKRAWAYCVIPIIFMVFISVIIPSRQTMMLMIGTSLAKDAIQSDIGKKVETILNKELDKYIKKDDK